MNKFNLNANEISATTYFGDIGSQATATNPFDNTPTALNPILDALKSATDNLTPASVGLPDISEDLGNKNITIGDNTQGNTYLQAGSLLMGRNSTLSTWMAGAKSNGGLWNSQQGVDWQQSIYLTNTSINNLYYINYLWYTATSDGIWTSPDGLIWTQLASTVGIEFFSIKTNGFFVATAIDGIYYSTDGGNTWVIAPETSGIQFNVVDVRNNHWIAGSTANSAWYSNNGINWTQSSSGILTGTTLSTLAYLGSVWVASDTNLTAIVSSIDNGQTWQVTSNNIAGCTTLTVANNLLVGASQQGIWTSPDGLIWTQISGTELIKFAFITFANNNVWLASALGNNDTNDGIWRSADNAISFTQVFPASGSLINDIASNVVNFWTATSADGSIYYSYDTQTWNLSIGTSIVAYATILYGDGNLININSYSNTFNMNGNMVAKNIAASTGESITYSPSSTIYVSSNGSDTMGTGKLLYPYQTIGKAMSMANPGDTIEVSTVGSNETIIVNKQVAINCAPSVNILNIEFVAGSQNTTINNLNISGTVSSAGFGGISFNNCNLSGNNGPYATRLYSAAQFADILALPTQPTGVYIGYIDGSSDVQVYDTNNLVSVNISALMPDDAITYNTTNQFLTITQAFMATIFTGYSNNGQGLSIDFNGDFNSTGGFNFNDCQISGTQNFNCGNANIAASNTATLGWQTNIFTELGKSTYLLGLTIIAPMYHAGGIDFITSGTSWASDPLGVLLYSPANDTNFTDVFVINGNINGRFGSTLGTIQQTGAGFYAINAGLYSATTGNTFNGTRIPFNSAGNLFANYTPTNYTIGDGYVTDALAGIDGALGSLTPSDVGLGNVPNVDATNASNSSSGTLANARTTATDANTASTIVARDASGDFSAGTITASLSGNATTATTATNLSGTITNASWTPADASGSSLILTINSATYSQIINSIDFTSSISYPSTALDTNAAVISGLPISCLQDSVVAVLSSLGTAMVGKISAGSTSIALFNASTGVAVMNSVLSLGTLTITGTYSN